MEVGSLYREPAVPTTEIAWPALEFVDVFKLFRSGPVETVALRGLNLRVEAGEFVAVFGPSGSGKSTCLSLAAGTDKASAGEVRAFGASLRSLNERELASYRAHTVAIVFQSGNLWDALTARENVLVSLKLAGLNGAGGRADRALASFGLAGRAHHRTSSLSGGEQQRVAIAAAAAREPRLVLADEPTGELDAAAEDVVLEALAALRGSYGATVVAVTHSRRVAEAADRAVALMDGRAADS